MSPPLEVVERIVDVALWIPADFCSEVNQQYTGTDLPGGMESDLRPFTIGL